MYIGETSNFQRRFNQHLMKTFKHSDACDHKCKRCVEHSKYKKHRAAYFCHWIMIPVWRTTEKYEGKRLEHKLIQKWRPSLNSGDKPFWMLKSTYANESSTRRKPRTRTSTRAPWNGAPNAIPVAPRVRGLLTTFAVHEERHLDFGLTMKRIEDEGSERTTVFAMPGHTDLTNWRSLKKVFGDSKLEVTDGNSTDALTILLKHWDASKYFRTCSGQIVQIIITPARSEVLCTDVRELLAEAEAFIERQEFG